MIRFKRYIISLILVISLIIASSVQIFAGDEGDPITHSIIPTNPVTHTTTK